MRGARPTLYLSAVQLARSWDRDRDLGPIARREPPTILIWWCTGGCGGGYTDRGSHALGYCTRCGAPRPATSAPTGTNHVRDTPWQ